MLIVNCTLVWLPVSHHTFVKKAPTCRDFFVVQPGIEPRFSEPKSDVIAFIPLDNRDTYHEIGCKGTAFF